MDGATSAATIPRKYTALPRSSSRSAERAAQGASMSKGLVNSAMVIGFLGRSSRLKRDKGRGFPTLRMQIFFFSLLAQTLGYQDCKSKNQEQSTTQERSQKNSNFREYRPKRGLHNAVWLRAKRRQEREDLNYLSD